jgi:signal transduction histidine kinase/ActR/RegA family two-component response regulator
MDLLELARHLCGASMAAISLTDDQRQWFKYRTGFNREEYPRQGSFCELTLRLMKILVIKDAKADASTAQNPLVTSEPNVRSYIGVPLVRGKHQPFGTLCVMHGEPLQPSPGQLASLEVLARLVEGQFEFQRRQAELEAQVLRLQRLESMGALASGVVHQLNNIFVPIMMGAAIVREGSDPNQIKEALAMIEKSAQSGADLIKQMASFDRALDNKREPLSVEDLLQGVIRIMQSTFPRKIQLQPEVPKDLWMVSGSHSQLHQVCLNLCVHARDAMPQGGTLTLKAGNVRLNELDATANPQARLGPYVCVEVADTGRGIALQDLKHVFDPAFALRSEGAAAGLGLVTAASMVKAHGGFIEVQSQPGRGSRFLVFLPALPEQTRAATAPAAAKASQGGTILVVDDEETLRLTTKIVLERQGFNVITAKDGAEALAHYVKNFESIRAVITDLSMPVMDGPSLALAVRGINPSVPIIVWSGWDNPEYMAALNAMGIKKILAKPFNTERLLASLQEALSGSPSA